MGSSKPGGNLTRVWSNFSIGILSLLRGADNFAFGKYNTFAKCRQFAPSNDRACTLSASYSYRNIYCSLATKSYERARYRKDLILVLLVTSHQET